METTKDGYTEEPTQPRDKGGRPAGSFNKFSRKAREWGEQTGLLPHEILLKLARGESILRQIPEVDPVTQDMRIIRRWETPNLEQMIDCAKAAAPYFAPKFGNIEFIKNLTNEELAELYALATSESAQADAGAGDATPPGSSAEGAEAPGASVSAPSETRRRRLPPC